VPLYDDLFFNSKAYAEGKLEFACTEEEEGKPRIHIREEKESRWEQANGRAGITLLYSASADQTESYIDVTFKAAGTWQSGAVSVTGGGQSATGTWNFPANQNYVSASLGTYTWKCVCREVPFNEPSGYEK